MTHHGVAIEIQGPLAVVRLDLGAGSNFLSGQVLQALADTLANLAPNGGLDTICLSGRPEAFLLGVDVSLFVNHLMTGDIAGILEFTGRTRTLLSQISRMPQATVAWVQGAALGGGLELSLACRHIVASATAKFALPETGLGIYPGMGGTQRLPRRIGVGLAKWMIYTGAIVPADHALAIGLVDAISPATTADEAAAALEQPRGQAVDRMRHDVLERLFSSNTVDALLDPAFPQPADPHAIRALVQLRTKAPVALRLAEKIIDRGVTLPLSEGLDLEFAHLAEVFATEDARIGLTSLGKSRPQFTGR